MASELDPFFISETSDPETSRVEYRVMVKPDYDPSTPEEVLGVSYIPYHMGDHYECWWRSGVGPDSYIGYVEQLVQNLEKRGIPPRTDFDGYKFELLSSTDRSRFTVPTQRPLTLVHFNLAVETAIAQEYFRVITPFGDFEYDFTKASSRHAQALGRQNFYTQQNGFATHLNPLLGFDGLVAKSYLLPTPVLREFFDRVSSRLITQDSPIED